MIETYFELDFWAIIAIKIYIIMIVKEFIVEELWRNYNTLWGSIKTTVLLILIPIYSLSIMFHYILINDRDKKDTIINEGELK